MSVGPWQLLIVALLILLLFGRGRISEMMGDFGKGIKSFKQGIAESDEPKQAPPAPPRIDAAPAPAPTENSSSLDKTGQ